MVLKCYNWGKIGTRVVHMFHGLSDQTLDPSEFSTRRFSKLTKFSANCHLTNDWSCFVEHKLLHPSDLPAFMILWYSSGLISQRLGVQIPAEDWEFFFIFEKYLCKLPIGN